MRTSRWRQQHGQRPRGIEEQSMFLEYLEITVIGYVLPKKKNNNVVTARLERKNVPKGLL